MIQFLIRMCMLAKMWFCRWRGRIRAVRWLLLIWTVFTRTGRNLFSQCVQWTQHGFSFFHLTIFFLMNILRFFFQNHFFHFFHFFLFSYNFTCLIFLIFYSLTPRTKTNSQFQIIVICMGEKMPKKQLYFHQLFLSRNFFSFVHSISIAHEFEHLFMSVLKEEHANKGERKKKYPWKVNQSEKWIQ